MSGTRAPAARGTIGLRLPRAADRVDPTTVNNAFDLLERADGANVKTGQQPTFSGIVLLSAPGRIGYLLEVADDGALQVTQLPAVRV
jgi:hypothetical protein